MTCDVCRCDELRMHHAVPVMLFALRECASRLRYDGDHHSDLGLESRRDASWEAMRLAESALAMATGDFQSMGEPVSCRPLIRSGEGEPASDPGLQAGSPMNVSDIVERCAHIAAGQAEFVAGHSHEQLCHTIAKLIREEGGHVR